MVDGLRGFQDGFTNFIQSVAAKTTNCALSFRDPAGKACDIFASVKDSREGFNAALSGGKDMADLLKHLRGKRVIPKAFSERLSGATGVMEASAIFGDLYYLASCEWIDDLKERRFLPLFGNLAFTAKDGISAFLGVKEMAEISSDKGADDRLRGFADAFAVAGFCGHVSEDVRTLIEERGGNLDAWFSLSSRVVDVSLPILGLAGVTNVPLLLSLGVLSATFGVASTVVDHRNKEEPASPLNFAATTEGLGKLLAPFASLGILLSKIAEDDTLQSFRSAIGNTKPLAGFSSGLSFISRGKDWLFADANGKYKWQSMSSWGFTKQAALTVQSGMDLLRFLSDSTLANLERVVDSKIGGIPLFGSVRDALGVTAFGCSLVDDFDKLKKNREELAIREVKQNRWKAFSDFLNKEGSLSLLNTALEAQCKLAKSYYGAKSELEGALGGNSGESEAKADRLDRFKEAIWRGAIPFVEAKKAARIAKLEAVGRGSLKKGSAERKLVKLNEMDIKAYVLHKSLKAKWKVDGLKVDRTKMLWGTAQDALKVAIPLISLAGTFAGVAKTPPIAVTVAGLGFTSAVVGLGKYIVDATLRVGGKPSLAAA